MIALFANSSVMISSTKCFRMLANRILPRLQISRMSTSELDPVSASYPAIIKELDQHRSHMLSRPNRYQVMSQREDRSVYSVDNFKSFFRGRYITRYKDIITLKNPLDHMTLVEMLQVVKPATVIEFGTFNGGSTLVIDDVLKGIVDNYSIYSLDVNTSMRDKSVDKFISKNVNFIQGSSYDVEKVFPIDFLESLPRPLILIEDCHRNVRGIMEHFHNILKPGDYLVIEDTCPIVAKYPWVGEEFNNYTEIKSEYTFDGDETLKIVRKYLTEQEEFYAIDTYFCDLFGYNCTSHWNAFIRRMK